MAALVAVLGVGHTISITSGPLSLALDNLLGSIPVAVVAALVAALVRLAGYRLRGLADVDPTVIWRVALVGLFIGLCGMIGTAIAQTNPRLILGSGEGYIVEVVQMTSLSTLFVIIVAKGIAYSLSLGGGIRGGPIFPAMFLGAAVGAVASVLHVPGESTALAAAGLLASTTVGLAVGWRGLVIGGVVVGLLLGSWLLIPPSIVGMLVGRGVGSAMGRLPGVGPVPDPVQQAARLDDRDSLGS